MRKESTESRSESRPEWEQLEDWVRSQVQRLIQELLEEEVTAFLGRAKSALRSDSDNDTGYRNGYGRARRLTLSSGTIQLRRPRVRDTEEQFESRLLPLFVNRTRKVAELIPELYLHGLSEGDFDLALRGLLGEDAPVSASTVARLKDKWNDELAQWLLMFSDSVLPNWPAKMSDYGDINVDSEGAGKTSGAQQLTGRAHDPGPGGNPHGSERTPHQAHPGGL